MGAAEALIFSPPWKDELSDGPHDELTVILTKVRTQSQEGHFAVTLDPDFRQDDGVFWASASVKPRCMPMIATSAR